MGANPCIGMEIGGNDGGGTVGAGGSVETPIGSGLGLASVIFCGDVAVGRTYV